MIANDFRKTDTLGSGLLLQRASGVLAALCLVVFLVLGAAPADAQVQIKQVEDVSSAMEGVTSEQLTVTVEEGEEEVSRGDVLGLIPGSTPALRDGSGNRAVVAQQGNQNDASITQRGRQNQASATQQGKGNVVSVTQGGIGIEGGGGFLPPPFSSFPDVPAEEAFENAEGVPFLGEDGRLSGEDNLAVAVQEGSNNVTTIQQYGRKNKAGIRLIGRNNEVGLLQIGRGNEYLLDHTGSGLDLTGSKRIEQIGRGNRMIEVGRRSVPMNIQQRGNGMAMIVRHNQP